MEQNAQTLKLEEIIRPVVEGLGFELVDLTLHSEGGRLILRVTADKAGGINIDECAAISRELAPHLEVSDPVASRYNLEVSSPGLRRPLKKADDFKRFSGEVMVVKTTEPLEGQRRFKGVGRGIDADGRVLIKVEDKKEVVAIDFEMISKANLDPEIKF